MPSKLTPTDLWTPSPDALVTDLEHELVILHALSGEMFSLSGSGRAAWLALPGDLSAVAAVLETQGAPPEQSHADAEQWLTELRQQGLVTAL